MYLRLRDAPLFVKIIKLADEFHNLRTLSGWPFLKALKTYLRYAESWRIIFRDDEYEQFTQKKIIINPLPDGNGKDLRSSILPNSYKYAEKIHQMHILNNLLEEISKILPKDYKMDLSTLLGIPTNQYKLYIVSGIIKKKIVNLLSEIKGSMLSRAGESQVIYAYEKESDSEIHDFIDNTIDKLSFENLQVIVAEAIYIDNDISVGKSEIEVSTGGLRSSVELLLHLLEINGKKFLNIKEEEFRVILKNQITKQRKFDEKSLFAF